MASESSHTHCPQISRRRFFVASVSTAACAGITASVEQAEAGSKVVRIGPAERPRSDIDAWNVGLITGCRRGRNDAENEACDAELRAEIRRCFGFLHLRGRYIEKHELPCSQPTKEHAYLVFGRDDDSGNLKGFLRKYARRYGQDSVIHKGYYRDAYLHALRDLPGLGMRNGDAKSLGRFHPSRLGVLYTLMTRGGARTSGIAIENLQSGPEDVDYLGGRWEDIGLWTPRSFFSRAERRVVFEQCCRAD